MLTDVGDVVVDPFAGSCVTGEVAERLKRRWICCEIVKEYVEGGVSRFGGEMQNNQTRVPSYSLPNPSSLWELDENEEDLPKDGGRKRPPNQRKET